MSDAATIWGEVAFLRRGAIFLGSWALGASGGDFEEGRAATEEVLHMMVFFVVVCASRATSGRVDVAVA